MNQARHGMARSDALVLFGVTGDLVCKKIFPALYAMAKHGRLDVPLIGVATSNLSLARLRERATASIRAAGACANGGGASQRRTRFCTKPQMPSGM